MRWYFVLLIIIVLLGLSGGIYMFRQQPEQVLIEQEQNNPIQSKSSYVSQVFEVSPNPYTSKYIIERQDGNESFYDVSQHQF
jgi:hypothetical protein